MPRATISVEPERFELKTCEEGFVLLRRMPYGMWLHRQELAMRLRIEGQQGSKEIAGEMAMANKKVTVYEFSQCIVDHNLTGDDDQPLDFTKESTLDKLDPRIGNEIGDLIAKMHELDEGN